MVENEINNNLVSEKEEEKKTKKNKLYSTLAITIIAIGAGAGLGTYFSLHKNHNSTPTPIISVINLNELNLNTKIDEIVQDSETAFNLFINDTNNIKNYPDLTNNVEVGTFTLNYGTTATTLEIKAKANTNYTGTIKVNFLGQEQTNINEIFNTEDSKIIQGTETMLNDSYDLNLAFQTFISKAKINWNEVESYVSPIDFTKPNYINNGSLTITAKENTKYTGNIKITIKAIGQINLSTLTFKEITGTENMDSSTVFNDFIKNNSNLSGNVTLGGFSQPTYTTNGSLTITATSDGKYSNSATINISQLTKTDLSTLGLNLTLSEAYTNQQDAFNAFINLNSQISDLKDNIKVTNFTPSNYGVSGSLEITSTVDGKYNGTALVDISAIKQINLNTLHQNAIDGIENMTIDDAFNAFLANNDNINDLTNNVELSFKQPNYTSTGSLTISAKTNSKYSGTITIIINAIKQINLNNLNLNLTVSEAYTNQQDAFNAFINLNSQISDLNNNTEIKSFIAPGYTNLGSLIINGINKYTGSITITINMQIPTDQEIVDAVINSDIIFDAFKVYKEPLDSFISTVINGINNPSNPDNDPYWYIRNQLNKHINDYPILNYADVTKYEFIQLCVKDDNHTPLTDAYLKSHYTIGDTAIIQVNFNYGDVKNQYIDFYLSLTDIS